MASPFTYEQMKARQRALGPTGPAGPIGAEASPPTTAAEAETDSSVLHAPALEPHEPVPAGTAAAAAKTMRPLDVNVAKRAVVLNALRNAPEATKLFAQHIRRAYKMGSSFQATDQEVLQAAFDLSRENIPNLTPHEYEKAIHDLYGPDVDKRMIAKAHEDYPGITDETKLIDEVYRRKIAKEELGPITYEDKADILARRFADLHSTNLEPDAALQLKYKELKKAGKNVGSYDDWLHAMMAPTFLERVGQIGGAIKNGIVEQGKQVATLGQELGTPGKLVSDIVMSQVAGEEPAGQAATERLKDAGQGAVTAASLAAAPLAGAGIAGLARAAGMAKTAPALTGAAEGIVAGGLQGGGAAAIEGQTPEEIAQAAATNAGIGGLIGAGLGAYGGHVQKVRAAAAAEEEAAKLAAAKAAGSADLPPKPTPAVPVPPTTNPLDLAAQHGEAVRWEQNVQTFAAQHGMDPLDVKPLVSAEAPSLIDLAAANQRHGVTAAEVAELRAAMPEHMKVPTGGSAPAPVEAPAPTPAAPLPVPSKPATVEQLAPERGALQSEVSDRLTHALNRAQGQLAQRRAMIRQQLSERFARAREAYGSAGGGLAGVRAQLRMMAGEMKKPDWAGVADEFKDVNVNALHDAIQAAPMMEGDKLTAHAGLQRLWNGTKMGAPTASQLRVLRMAFGSEFVDAAVQNRTAWQKVGDVALKFLNTPRTLMTSFDLSAGMRQGYLMTSHPEYWRAWKTMVKSFGSQKVADDVVLSIKENPKYDLMRESGLFFQGEPFGSHSETFAGSFADHWAGVRQSQRAYDTFINKVRADVFSETYDKLAQAGVDVSDPHFRQSLAHWVNTGTGRGSLAGIGRDAGTLNALMFSPRLAWSRVETFNPMYYSGLHPAVRRAAMKSNMLTLGATMGLLGTMAGSKAANVKWDPRSSDFAKLQFGNTRIDMLGGHQQFARLFAQMITGKVISSTTGRMIDLNGSDAKNGWARLGMTRMDVLQRFMEAKAAPLASLAITMMRGKDFLGNPVSIPNEIATRFTPMPIEDVAEAVREGGWGKGLGLVAPAAVVGLGTQTYTPNMPSAAGGGKNVQEGAVMNIGHWLYNHLNGIDDSPTELAKLTPQIADQWVKDAAAAQVMGQHEATQLPNFFDKGFDQQAEIRKATARRMARVNKLYKDLVGGNGEGARLAAEKDLLKRRAEATGMDIEALRNPNAFAETNK